MIIKLYTKNDCSFCVQAKSLLKQKTLPFEEILIGRDIEKDVFKTHFPQIKTVPAIFINGKFIGGYTNLVEYLK
jgi:glutaredoxin